LASFSPVNSDLLIYTGYGVQKEISIYSMTKRKVRFVLSVILFYSILILIIVINYIVLKNAIIFFLFFFSFFLSFFKGNKSNIFNELGIVFGYIAVWKPASCWFQR